MPEAKTLDNVPILETPRLVLRGHRLEDFAGCAALWADPAVTRHITGKPSTPEESWARLLRYVGHWALMGYGFWVIEEKASGAYIGETGFADFKRQMEPPLGDTPEIGWVLSTGSHGKGYATEAVQAVVAWGDAHWGNRPTVCIVAPDNLASIHVARKCGYVERERGTYRGEPTIIFER
jgi:RimJ/RimL family protein N-acetyltransferase